MALLFFLTIHCCPKEYLFLPVKYKFNHLKNKLCVIIVMIKLLIKIIMDFAAPAVMVFLLVGKRLSVTFELQ